MKEIKIIDAHTHINFPQFDKDREEVIKRAFENDIGMISIGTDIEMTEKAIDIASENENIWATAGIHPHDAIEYNSFEDIDKDIKILEELASDDNVVGIGECGLDYSQLKDEEEKKKQKYLFSEQIKISHKTNKPIIIHCRDAFDDVLEILEENKDILLSEPGICHFFTGDIDLAKQFLDLGFSFTFGGLITKTCEFDDVLNFIPNENILIETDAPFVSPKSKMGKRNEPLFILETLDTLSKIKEINSEKMAEITKNNTERVFNLK